MIKRMIVGGFERLTVFFALLTFLAFAFLGFLAGGQPEAIENPQAGFSYAPETFDIIGAVAGLAGGILIGGIIVIFLYGILFTVLEMNANIREIARNTAPGSAPAAKTAASGPAARNENAPEAAAEAA